MQSARRGADGTMTAVLPTEEVEVVEEAGEEAAGEAEEVVEAEEAEAEAEAAPRILQGGGGSLQQTLKAARLGRLGLGLGSRVRVRVIGLGSRRRGLAGRSLPPDPDLISLTS